MKLGSGTTRLINKLRNTIGEYSISINCDETGNKSEGCFFRNEELKYIKSFEYKYDNYKPNYKESFHTTTEIDTDASEIIRNKLYSRNDSV